MKSLNTIWPILGSICLDGHAYEDGLATAAENNTWRTNAGGGQSEVDPPQLTLVVASYSGAATA